jgi:hypothetical protein
MCFILFVLYLIYRQLIIIIIIIIISNNVSLYGSSLVFRCQKRWEAPILLDSADRATLGLWTEVLEMWHKRLL